MLGVNQQSVSQWVTAGFVPLKWVPLISDMTGVPGRRLCSAVVLRAVDAGAKRMDVSPQQA